MDQHAGHMSTIAAQIQFIPLSDLNPMTRVDEAIALIQSSGLSHEVGPFGTSVEGPISQVNELIIALQGLDTTEEFLLNVQYHIGDKRLSNFDKVAKFR